MEKVLLISEETLKSETVINDNVDDAYIRPAIECSQDIYLHQLIGTSLLNDLCAKVRENTLTDDDKLLLDEYITPYLKFKVCSEITLVLAYKYRNAGIVQTQTDFVSNSIMKDAQLMKDYYDQRANFYAIRLTDWLCANSAKFPNYHNHKTGDVCPNRGAYNTNIYLG